MAERQKREEHGDGGAGAVDWQPGDKAVLHFKTTNTATNHVLDNTRQMHLGPFELRVGKNFLLEEWETVVKSMKVGETKSFLAADDTVRQYPQLARVLRKESARKHAEEHGHEFHDHPTHGCFHHMAHDTENTDLLELAPDTLQCELELLSVEKAETFEKELWEMTLEQKLEELPRLKDQGRGLFKEKRYSEAANRYTRALALLENLSNKKHLDPTHMDDAKHKELMDQKPTFLANLAACELVLKQYPDVILHCTMGLDIDPQNTKLLYRRAKAHFERGRDLDKADADAKAALEQNPDDKGVQTLAARISKALAAAKETDKKLYTSMFKGAMP